MPINKSYGQEMDKRTRELEKRSSGSGGQALQEQQLAQNQLQAIQNEQRSNLMSQRTEAAAIAQQNQLLSQAAELGVSSSTAATLGKYGMKTPPRVQRQQGRQVSVTPNKITIINNTNTTTTNNNQVQAGGSGGNTDSAAKFKTWLGKVNLQQEEQASKRDRDYARRESSLTRSANKMLRRIEKVGSSVAEAFSPETFGQTVGSQLKMYLLIFGMRFLSKYWTKVLDAIGWIGETFETFTSWLGFGAKGEALAKQGKGLIPTVIRLLGGDPQRESVADAFQNSLKAAFDHFSDKLDHMMEERSEAMKKVKLNVKTDGALGGILKGLGLEDLFQGITTYLGDILTALVNPKAGVAKQVSKSVQEIGMKGSSNHMNKGQFDNESFGVDKGDLSVLDKNNKHRYGLIQGAVGPGNILTSKVGGQVSQSLDVIGALKDAKETGYVDPARFLAGLERMQNKARLSGFIAVDKEFLTTFLTGASIRTLTNTGHIKLKDYKVVKIKKSDAMGLGGYTARAGIGAGTGAIVGGWVGAGVGTLVGLGEGFVKDMMDNDHTLEFAPMDDPREAYKNMKVTLFEIDEYVLKQIALQFNSDRFDTSSEKLMEEAKRFIYERSGGIDATRRRYKGRGSNESLSVSSTYRPIHEYENLHAAHEMEEKSDPYSRRKAGAGEAWGELWEDTKDLAEDAYEGVKKFFTEPTGQKGETYYDPNDHIPKRGQGPRSANIIEKYTPPTTSRFENIKLFSHGILKSPLSTEYTFSVKSAIDEAERLSQYIITNKSPKFWKLKSSTARLKSITHLAKYTRLAIAKGLGKNDLDEAVVYPTDFVDILHKYGFCPVSWDGYSPRRGDICIFGPTPNKNTKGYSSIFSGNHWISDHVQVDFWPDDEFKSNRCATIFRHLNVVADKTQGDILAEKAEQKLDINSIGELGTIDFNGDGRPDAIKYSDGIYRLDENGAVTGEKIDISNLNSMWSSNSSVSYIGDSMDGGILFTPTSYGGVTHVDGYTMYRSKNGSDKWVNAVERMKDYFKYSVHDYKNTPIHCNGFEADGITEIRPDCSGFVWACLKLYGVRCPGTGYLASDFVNSSLVEKLLRSAGFKPIAYSGPEAVRPYDIMASRPKPGHKSGHAQIAAPDGYGMTYNCGSPGTMRKPASEKMPSNYSDFWTSYEILWRHEETPTGYGTGISIQEGAEDVQVDSWDAPAPSPSNTVGIGDNSYDISFGSNNVPSISSGGNIDWGSHAAEWSQAFSSGVSGGVNLDDDNVRAALNHSGPYRKGEEQKFVRDVYLGFRAAGLPHGAALGATAQAVLESNYGTHGWSKYNNFGNIQRKGYRSGQGDRFKQNYRNLGDYIIAAKNLLDKRWPGATTAETPFEYLRIVQGLDQNGNPIPGQYAWCANEGGGHENDRINYVPSTMKMMPKIAGYLGSGEDFDLTQYIGEQWNKGEEFVQQALSSASSTISTLTTPAYRDINKAIKGEIPAQAHIASLEDDFSKTVESLADDELAAQVWLNNATVRNQYGAYGFENWKKYIFDPKSRAEKQRYVVEMEGQDIIERTSVKDTYGHKWSGLNNVLDKILGPEYYNPDTGELTEKGMVFARNAWASYSPEQRRRLAGNLILEQNWKEMMSKEPGNEAVTDVDLANDIVQSLFPQGKDFILNNFLENTIDTSSGANLKFLSNLRESNKEDFNDLIKNIYLGNINEVKKSYKKLFEEDISNQALGKLFAPEQYKEISENLNNIIENDSNLEKFSKASFWDNDKSGGPWWQRWYANLMAHGYHEKKLADGFYIDGGGWFDDELDEWLKQYTKQLSIKNSSGDKIKTEEYFDSDKFIEDYYKTLATTAALERGRYVQENLTKGFEDITDSMTAREVYDAQRRNEERAKINQQRYDLQYQLGINDEGKSNANEHGSDTRERYLTERFYNDEDYHNEMLFGYGAGRGAIRNWMGSEEGQRDYNELLEKYNELNNKFNEIKDGSSLKGVSDIVDKFKQVIEDNKEGLKTDEEELHRANVYATKGETAFETAYAEKLSKSYNTNDSDEKRDKAAMEAYNYAMAEKAKSGAKIWEYLTGDLISGKISLDEAKAIRNYHGLEKVISDEQLENIQKNKTAGKAPLSTFTDQSGNMKFYGADGNEIMVEDKDENGNPIKRGMRISDTKHVLNFMKQSSILEDQWGNLGQQATYDIDGKQYTLVTGEDGEWYYQDKDGNLRYYDNPYSQGGHGFVQDPSTVKLTGTGPSLNAQVHDKKFRDTIKTRGYDYLGVKLDKNADVNTTDIDFSKFKDVSDETMLQEIAKFMGMTMEEFTRDWQDKILKAREENPNGKLTVAIGSTGGLKIGQIVKPDGETSVAMNKEALKVGMSNIEQQAIEYGFAGQTAKLYAEGIQKEQFAKMEVQRKLQEGHLNMDALHSQQLEQILHAVLDIPAWIKAKGDEEEYENNKNKAKEEAAKKKAEEEAAKAAAANKK